ncbi:MAG: CTP-dependent riboflavin kinase [Crenarchaeota archaeon]|nr:CTP-dependent riboflavin kinase [Thermoproteota archaeon]
MRKTIVKGVVVSGLGEGRKYVTLYAEEFRKSIGIIPYPGTLNIKLEKPLDDVLSRHKHIIVEPPSKEFYPVLLYCAELRGRKVYLVRPLKTRHGNKIAEIISDKYLRKELGLKDGDEVILEITDCSCQESCSGDL